MSTSIDLHRNRDGAALKAMALEGDVEAALLFSDLVCEAKYAGDTTGGISKKAAKEAAQEDAINLVRQAAETGSIKALQEWASMNYEGRREPGHFGGTVMTSFYGVSEELYRQLLEHPECSKEQRTCYLYRQGFSILMKARIKGLDRTSEVMDLWQQAIIEGGLGADMAEQALSDLYWRLSEHGLALTHARNVLETRPYAHLTLHNAYKHGLGVEPNPDEAARHYNLWFTLTEPKKKSKK